jgi:hypothetical protein
LNREKHNAFDAFVTGSSSPWDASVTLAGALIVQSARHVEFTCRLSGTTYGSLCGRLIGSSPAA